MQHGDMLVIVQVSLPGHICAVVVTTLVLEGWSSKLDPEQSIMDDIGHALHASKSPSWRQHLALIFSWDTVAGLSTNGSKRLNL